MSDSFHKAVMVNPSDDLPRLVYADWLDENGDPERAAFIRASIAVEQLIADLPEHEGVNADHSECDLCDKLKVVEQHSGDEWAKRSDLRFKETAGHSWRYYVRECDRFKLSKAAESGPVCLFRRGWPDRVLMTTDEFFGPVCPQCEGLPYHVHGAGVQDVIVEQCQRCCGEGRVPTGLALPIFLEQPITSVVLVDVAEVLEYRRIQYHDGTAFSEAGNIWGGIGAGNNVNLPSSLMRCVMEVAQIVGDKSGAVRSIWHNRTNPLDYFDALFVIDRACVLYGRRLAGYLHG